jgi:hypothetical protein
MVDSGRRSNGKPRLRTIHDQPSTIYFERTPLDILSNNPYTSQTNRFEALGALRPIKAKTAA